MSKFEEEVKDVIRAFRLLKARSARRSLTVVMMESGNEAAKTALVHALFELEEKYCAENGWESTNPLRRIQL